MPHLEILLMVIIIILLFTQYSLQQKSVTVAPVKSTFLSGNVDGREQMDVDNYNNPEGTANQEQTDYYNVCMGGIGARAPSCDDPCTSDLEYATHNFGGVNMSFADWAKAQSIDPQVMKNHDEFIRDRLDYSKTNNIVGRTYSPDTHDGYNEQKWVGIRGRPVAVKVCNPSQLAEANQAVYASKSRITWDSS